MARGRLTVKVTGVKELQKAIKEKRDEIFRAMVEAAKESAEIVRDDADFYVTRKSGELEASIKDEEFVNDPQSGKVITAVTANADDDKGLARAAFTELGTAHSEAKPFLRPALYDNKSVVKALFSRNIKAVINK